MSPDPSLADRLARHGQDHLLRWWGELDDARLFPRYLGGPVPLYCEPETERTIRRVFDYAFKERPPSASTFVPQLRFETIEPGVPFEVVGQSVLPIRLEHGGLKVLGFRVGGLAYCTDVSRIPDASWPMLEGLDVLVLDALRYEPHPTHFNLAEALAVVERLRPGRTVFTHLSHSFDHGPAESTLPPRVGLAYDGLTLEF